MSNWTKTRPTIPGKYQIMCLETDNDPQEVVVYQSAKGHLMVHDESIGQVDLESYANGLTYLVWNGPILAGHDPASVVVLDRETAEEVKDMLRLYAESCELGHADLDLPLQALAKLTASIGGEKV